MNLFGGWEECNEHHCQAVVKLSPTGTEVRDLCLTKQESLVLRSAAVRDFPGKRQQISANTANTANPPLLLADDLTTTVQQKCLYPYHPSLCADLKCPEYSIGLR